MWCLAEFLGGATICTLQMGAKQASISTGKQILALQTVTDQEQQILALQTVTDQDLGIADGHPPRTARANQCKQS